MNDPEPSSGDEREPSPARTDRLTSPAAWITAAFTVVVSAVLLAIQVGAFDSTPDKNTKHARDPGVVTTPPAASSTPKSKAVAITSCSCAFGDGQSTPQITLTINAPPVDASQEWSLGIERVFGFTAEHSSANFPVHAGAVLPPALDASAPTHMGVACDTGVFVLVADKAATGWSSVDGSWKWNATLPLPSVDAADAAANTSSGTDFTGGCSPLTLKNGAASLTLANGKRVSLSLNDGKIR